MSARSVPGWFRPTLDYLGPAALVVGYFVSHKDLMAGTWWMVAGSALALILGFAVERRIPPMPAVWGGAALVFGVLTLVFHDPRIIKMKTTFIDLAIGVALLAGLALRRNLLKLMLGEALPLSEAAWRKLTWRYGFFFIGLAVLNEIVWRTQPSTVWVLFRMPGLPLLVLAFALLQLPMMLGEIKRAEAALALTELQE